jgi:hypothetical protein
MKFIPAISIVLFSLLSIVLYNNLELRLGLLFCGIIIGLSISRIDLKDKPKM